MARRIARRRARPSLPPLPALCDELLEEIFLRLPAPADLARALTACTSFRRIITERSFLRRYGKLHPPPLLGLIDDMGPFHPAEAPHPSARLARALVRGGGADFFYSFVPHPGTSLFTYWFPRDARDGRVLLECWPYYREEGTIAVFSILAVCDPVSRRYVLLPPIPEDMTVQQERLVEFQPILAPLGEEEEDETSLKLICMASYGSKLVTFVFSSVSGQWCIAASPSWNSLGTSDPYRGRKVMCRFNYSSGCFYWTDLWADKLLMLDTSRMEFSTVNILNSFAIKQPAQSICMHTVVVGTEQALEMLTVVGNGTRTCFDLYRWQHYFDESSSDWQAEHVMALPRRYRYLTMGATDGFLFLRGIQEPKRGNNVLESLHNGQDVQFFSLEVKTSELKEVCRKDYFVSPHRVHPYFGFPPSLSKPSI